jgi:EAL domain-containing protein (putative c-di-GMP-specific phosphodiesterase class I)
MSVRPDGGLVQVPGEESDTLGPDLGEVRAAARSGQLRPYFQAVVDMKDNPSVLGAESLLRWHHPRCGVLAAAEFLHLVEQAGLLVEVDLASVEQLAADLSRLGHAGRCLERVWLNVSRGELFADSFLKAVASATQRVGLRGSRVGVEIPEEVLSADSAAVSRRLARVRALGVGVTIDHFGLGLGLSHDLGGVPFDAVKLDRSLVERVDQSDATKRAVAAAVAMAHASGAAVIAEGVERHSQFDVLREIGCDGAQGYLFGKAVPIGDLLGHDDSAPSASLWWG